MTHLYSWEMEENVEERTRQRRMGGRGVGGGGDIRHVEVDGGGDGVERFYCLVRSVERRGREVGTGEVEAGVWISGGDWDV